MSSLTNRLALALAMLGALTGPAARAQGSFINWENPPVHPMDMSPDGQTLALANLPNNEVILFDMATGLPVESARVPVGLDPVSVRFLNDGELWAVNVISDSVSVIDVAGARVSATIRTLDEPQDVVFAGSPLRAFVSCAAVSVIQVFNAATRAEAGQAVIAAEEPRALAVSPDGTRVYAAIFESGNRTTILGGGAETDGVLGTLGFPPNVVSDPTTPYGGVNPPPNGPGNTFIPAKSPANGIPPPVGLIVRQGADNKWRDDKGTDWTLWVSGSMAARSGRIPGWALLDHDLAIINANSLAVSYVDHMMNICMALGVNPASGDVYVVGSESINEVRFEPNVNGVFNQVVVAIADAAGPSLEAVRDLNPHLDYSTNQLPQSERDKSIGDPRGIVWTADGTRGFVTGMGSNNLIEIDASGARVGATPIEMGEGPTGIILDEPRGRIYIWNRFEGRIAMLSLAGLTGEGSVSLFDPTPASIRTGRKHLYDTHKTSGLGHVACASCHVDGKMDKLAWDLGDPAGAIKQVNDIIIENPQSGAEPGAHNNLAGVGNGVQQPLEDFHPMKGPMTTQTFQDIIGKEPFHWRGDRDGIEEFNGAFLTLQADDTNLDPVEMQEFEDFLATIFFPPNPFRNFDNTLPTSLATGAFASGRFNLAEGAPLPAGSAVRGLTLFTTAQLDARGALGNFGIDCHTCHTLPTGMGADKILGNTNAIQEGNNVRLTGDFVDVAPGPNGERHLFMTSLDGSTNKAIKVAQLRNQYKKTGFNMTKPVSTAGFGILHDGSVDSISRFVSEPVFFPNTDQEVADLVAFSIAFAGSDLPLGNTSGFVLFRGNILNLDVIGLDIQPQGPPGRDAHAGTGRSFTVASAAQVPQIGGQNGLTVMINEAEEPGTTSLRGIDLVVKGRVGGVARGWVYDRATNLFRPDDDGPGINSASLLALATVGGELTCMAVPRDSGIRIGIDEDEDTFGNKTERDACTDPANPLSNPDLGTPNIVTPDGPLSLGTWYVDAGPSAPSGVQIFNAGAGALNFKGVGIAIGGTDAADFHIVNNPPTDALAFGFARGISIVFDPSTVGSKSAELVIVTDDCDAPLTTIQLIGECLPGSTPTPAPTDTPSPTPTETPAATPTPPADGRLVGDFDNSGCTSLLDFLFLLDNWQQDFNGTPIGLEDFLALLDNWQLGPDCPE